MTYIKKVLRSFPTKEGKDWKILIFKHLKGPTVLVRIGQGHSFHAFGSALVSRFRIASNHESSVIT